MFRYDKGQIEVPDIEIEAFKAMLTFIYTMNFNGLDVNNLFDILEAANKYNIIGLVKKCADFLIEKLHNVFVSFQEARFLNMEALRWADEQCRQNDIECSAENQRKMLGPALFNIRLPLIPKEEFTKSVISTNVLTTEERFDVFQHYFDPKLSDAPKLFPSKFPTHRRYKKGERIEMEIEKVSEFALEEELLDPSKGFYNKDEDKVKLAIDVIVVEPKTDKIISDPNKSNGTLSMEIEKLSEFAREIEASERKSETLYIKGMPWKIIAKIKNGNNEKWLGIFLLCDASEKDGNWSRKCLVTFRIVSQKNGVRDFKKEFEKMVFNNEAKSWGYEFISFTELMDPSKGLYNKDEDKVTLAIHFTCEYRIHFEKD
ncbi:hypothetical protein niasHT_003329 [Heterodera trifolii]|uniref:MATH domain-containing protein n=1 Tax=Heterodera trifolii TaxID=157864 RepID=A0ABD2LXW1_9BILA